MGLTRRHGDLLEARGLDIELLERLGVNSCDELGHDTIAIPYFRGEEVVGIKYRTISGEKRFMQKPGSEQIFYNFNCLTDPTLAHQDAIVTEGELDCWAAMQSGFQRCVSVPGGAPKVEVADRASTKYEFVQAGRAILDAQVKEQNKPDGGPFWVLACDSDDPGAALRNDLSLRLDRRRCKWIKYPRGCKDLNDALQRYGSRGVVESVNRAVWIVGNIYRMSEIPPVPYAKPYDSGFPGIADHYKLRLGDFCVVTGIPSHGKSLWVRDIACRMAMQHKWPACFASFEETALDMRRALRSWYGGGLEKNLEQSVISQADQWIDQWLTFIVADEDEVLSLDWLMERMAAAALRNNSRLFIVDPWNQIAHQYPDGMSKTDYVGEALRQLKRFARRYEVHLIVVCHPHMLRRDPGGQFPMPDLYDCADSANWYNAADVGVVVHRKSADETVIRIGKVKFQDEIGVPGDISVRYHWEEQRYDSYSNDSYP